MPQAEESMFYMNPNCPMDQQEELREMMGEKSRLQFLQEWERGEDTNTGNTDAI